MRKLGAIAVIAFISALFVLPGCKKDVTYIDIGRKAPDFTVMNIDGGNARLSDYRGKVVMLEFWATWCPPCIEAVPELNRLHEKFKDKNFIMLNISVDEGTKAVETIKKFRKKYDVRYPIYHDNTDMDKLYGVIRIPMTFIIDKKGAISSIISGYRPGLIDELAKDIEALL